jgi:protocatechuate 3,4-dioxygenase beta subunit
VTSAQATDPNANVPAKPEDLCTLEGNIYSLKTGQPLTKAEIHLSPEDRNQKNSYGATTDAAGHYVLENVTAGKYDLAATRNGYVRTSYGPVAKKRATTIITLSPGQHMTKLDIKLPPQAVVTGRVLDEDNEPMSNVTVKLMRRGYQNGKPTMSQSESSTTNDKGEYRIFGVGPGKYWAMATNNSRMMVIEQREVRSTKSGQASYAPVYYPSGLSVAEGAQLQITAGAELDGIDFHMTKSKSYSVSGKLLNANTTRLAVQLMPHDADGSPGWDRMKMAMVDKDGTFIFQGVTPGRYDLAAMQFSQDDRRSAHADVIVANEDVDVPLAFVEGAEVRGVIRSDDPSDVIKETMTVFLQSETPNMMGGTSGESKEDGWSCPRK